MIHIINENNELKGRFFRIPDGVKNMLEKTLKEYHGDKTVNGYKRLNNLVKSESISYYEMKRIKNFFDTFQGSDKSSEFVLNGGEPMKLWVNNALYTATKSIHDYKQAKKDAGMKNAFIKHHNKERQVKKNKPTQTKASTNDAGNRIMNNDFLKYESKSKNIFIISESQLKEILK